MLKTTTIHFQPRAIRESMLAASRQVWLASLGAAAVMTLAVGVVFWAVGRSPSGLSEAAILLPALVMGLGQGRSFATTWGAMTECLGYLAQLFDFLDHPFDESEAAHGATSRSAAAPTIA